jgi:PIN domain nuclease of toxin-antitoxin system
MEGDELSYLLDTNAWKWLAAGKPVRVPARVLTEIGTALFLLDISLWEICKAVETGTLVLDLPPIDWLKKASAANITILTITPDVAVKSCELRAAGLQTYDPADQLIVAAAVTRNFTLVTRDQKIIRWGGVQTLVY